MTSASVNLHDERLAGFQGEEIGTSFDGSLASLEETLLHLERDGKDKQVSQHLESIYKKFKPFQERLDAKKRARRRAQKATRKAEKKAAKQQAVQSSLSNHPEIWRDNIFSFLGMGHYAFVGLVNKQFYQLYKAYCDKVPLPNRPLLKLVDYEHDLYTIPATSMYTSFSAAFYNKACAKHWHADYTNDDLFYWLARLEEWRVCTVIASTGNIRVLKWAQKEGFQEGKEYLERELFTSGEELISYAAAKHGHLKMLQYSHRNGGHWDEYTCEYAARNGHFDLLKWLVENGCPWWNEEAGWDNISCDAARGGHFEILKYLHEENGCSINGSTCASAAKGGHFDILKWLVGKGCPIHARACAVAAKGGHFEILKWLVVENGCPIGADTCAAAAEGGHLDILMWLRESERECAWGNTCAKAAQAGHAEVLKWARENGCPWNEEKCWRAAIREGHLNVLKWARGNGCRWYRYTCSLAAEYGRLEVLKWARANDCPWNAKTCSSAAWAPVGHLDVLIWAHQNGCLWDERTCSCSLEHENWHILRWALAHGCPCDEATYNEIARKGRMDILQYQSLDLAD